jgi:signal transduction histidine kinase
VAAALAQKERFVASVCHDVQQPLTVILAQSQLLQRQLARGETLPPENRSMGHSTWQLCRVTVRRALQVVQQKALPGQPRQG